MKFMSDFYQDLPAPFLCLAPMAGYTNRPFRQICKIYGADVLCSEMASAVALSYGGKKTLELLRFAEAERPYVVQLFGADPKYFKRAAAVVTRNVRPDGIDLNMGCPARKVYKTGAGAALFGDLPRALAVIEETLAGTDLPVSVKIRAGVKNCGAMELVETIKDYPLSALMIHGRTYEQGFTGAIDLELIRRIKQLVKFPVIANGGIVAPEMAREILDATGVDGLAIGRGALKQPWLFRQIKNYLADGHYDRPNFAELKKIALLHAELAEHSMGSHGILELRKYLLWYFRGFAGAKDFRARLVRVESRQDVKIILDEMDF